MLSLQDKEKKILRILQSNLPDSLTPYADIAHACGVTEEDVFALIQRLTQAHAIRRFGAMIRHQKTDWVHNAMVAWQVAPNDRDTFGEQAARLPTVSHVYFRPSPSPEWPYTLYTMVHGRTEDECARTIAHLKAAWPTTPSVVLATKQELKKVSMRYF